VFHGTLSAQPTFNHFDTPRAKATGILGSKRLLA
jgi:hypothetical protein